MAFTPGFIHDIFISYCHDDNAAPKEKRGRVDHFQDDLESSLVTRFGSNIISIWRDKELQGNSVFDKKIQEKIRQSALFVALMSPNYLKSEFCLKELEWFHHEAEKSGCGLRINNESRIFNVLIRNIHYTKWPVQLNGTSAFPMHDEKKGSDSPGKFLDYEDKQYREKLDEIVDAVEKTLKLFPGAADRIEKSNRVTKEKSITGLGAMSIFIADTADSLQNTREKLVEDLTEEGVHILPEIPPPWKRSEHETAVQNTLNIAALAVHLLDGLPGRKIEDLKSLTFPRSQVAIGLRCHTRQLVWIPQNLDYANIEDREHAKFLESLDRREWEKADFEFIRGERNALPGLVMDVLECIRQQRVVKGEDKNAPILLDTHEKDQHFAIKLADYLLNKKITVEVNLEYRDPDSGLKNLETALTYARGLIIICGAVELQWVRKRLDKTINTICAQITSTNKTLLENLWVCFLNSNRETVEFENLPPIFKIEFLYNRYSDRPDEKALKPLLKYCNAGGAE